MSTTISPNSAEQVDTSQAATDPGGPQKASQRTEEYMPLTFPSLWSASEVPQGIQPEPSMSGTGLDQVVVPADTKANSYVPKPIRVISEKRSSDSSTSSAPLRRSGFLARRSGPATPPLHQLILANGALGTISILSSPATTTTGVSPRSSSSVESLMEDGTEARSSTSTLIDLLIEENKDLFTENQAVREEMEAREEALTRTKAEHESSKQRLAELEKQLDKKQKRHEITRRKLHWARNQWASAEFVSGIFSNGFKQQRSLADSRAKTVEELTTANEELQARLATLTQERDAVTEERNALQATQAASADLVSELKSQVETLERKSAMLVDRNASLALHVDELETRNEELGSTLEGMAARNEELCDTIRHLREHEEELELTLDEATREFNEMNTVLSELEYAYNELKSRSAAGSAIGDRDEDRASVTSEDMDLAGLEEAANAVGEDGEYLDAESVDKHRTPSKACHSRSRSYERPPSSISDVDTSDPIVVATQIKRLERLIEEYHDSIERLRAERIKLSDRAVELEAYEDDLRQRLDNFTELEIDLRNRENDYFATCEAREKEFLELSDEYERWRLDCEVREVDVEQERIDVWRFRKEVERRLERIVKREELVRKREGEVRWRMLCLDGALGDAEGCWRCVKAPAELFPPTPPLDFSHLDEEYRLIDEEEDRRRAEAAVVAANAGGEASHEEDIDERYLREEIDVPFEFDGREAVKRYLAEQEQHERDRRDDEYINLDEEANQLRAEAEVYDEIVNKRVAELIRKADEKRREVKERKERREGEESRRDEIAGQYDDEVANLNVDGLHGLGFVPHPDSYPDRYIEEPSVPTSAFTFTTGSSLSGSTSLSRDGPSTSSSTNEHHLVDSSAMRVNFAERLKERETQREAEEGMSSSWEEVPKDQA